MPYVTVKMLEGRTEEQKKALAEKVTAAVSETTGAPEEKHRCFLSKKCLKPLCSWRKTLKRQIISSFFHKKQPLAASYFFLLTTQ